MRGTKIRLSLLVGGAAAAMMVATAIPVGATGASAVITGNGSTPTFVVGPAAVAFTDTLSGVDQVASVSEVIDVNDSTGTWAGWNTTLTGTTFTNGTPAQDFSNTGVTLASAPSFSCDALTTCTTASPSTGGTAVSYPYTVPLAGTAPAATKFYSAASSTGMGDQKANFGFALAVPANTHSGTFNSTWTFSLVSAP